MKVLVVGNGAREHALCWKLRGSPLVKELYCAPGNVGMAKIADRVPIDPSSIVELADFAATIKVDLTVVGPELPLTLGIVDEFQKRDLPIFGATQAASEIESSKVFAKEFMKKHKIPTARFEVCGSAGETRTALKKRKDGFPVVLKADGLAGGKGVILARDRKEAEQAIEILQVERRFGVAGDRVGVEEFLEGYEASFFALSDGQRVLPLVTCQDYKRLQDGDTGPNTGGMGGYSPSVHIDADTFHQVMDGILVPTIAGLAEEGRPYRGVLYVGLMLTKKGPRVLEYNARFGDPEAELIAVRMKSDLVPVLQATLAGRLEEITIEWLKARSVCVVLAARGYPEKPETGRPITGTDCASALDGVEVFHAGTAVKEGKFVTASGRVLAVTALGATFAQARERCYAAAETVRFEGRHFRTDVAGDALEVTSG
ncbi:MAG: phosphoribosylamine--glycine ligase [Acidobacteria bacterium]|nr:MAG: phosphoribosylamine--glycine ligase [Acidobacteriota bacterium]